MKAVDREILRLAVPAFLALVAEPLFLLSDAAIVGHLGTPELAGLGIAAVVLQTVVGLCVFLAYGTTASVARHLGAGDLRAALAQGVDGIWLAVIIGSIATVAGVLSTPLLVAAFGTGPEVADHAQTYLSIAFLGTTPLLVMLAATGVLRGLQDTRTPLLVAVAGNALNIALNLFLVYGLDLGIAGSALGSVVAQVLSAAWLVAVVVRGAREQGAPLSPDRAGITAAAHAAVALVVRTLALRACLLVGTYAVTRVGTGSSDVNVATHQVAITLWTFLAFALDAIAIAAQALTGRALGSGDVEGTRRLTRRMVRWGWGSGLVAGAAAPLLARTTALRTAVAPHSGANTCSDDVPSPEQVVEPLVGPLGGRPRLGLDPLGLPTVATGRVELLGRLTDPGLELREATTQLVPLRHEPVVLVGGGGHRVPGRLQGLGSGGERRVCLRHSLLRCLHESLAFRVGVDLVIGALGRASGFGRTTRRRERDDAREVDGVDAGRAEGVGEQPGGEGLPGGLVDHRRAQGLLDVGGHLRADPPPVPLAERPHLPRDRRGQLPALLVEGAQLGGAEGALRLAQPGPQREDLCHLVVVPAHELVEQPGAGGGFAQALHGCRELPLPRVPGLLDARVACGGELLRREPVELLRDLLDAHGSIVPAAPGARAPHSARRTRELQRDGRGRGYPAAPELRTAVNTSVGSTHRWGRS